MLDEDLAQLSREQFIDKIKKLRYGILEHRTAREKTCAGIILNFGIYCPKKQIHKLKFRNGPNL